MDKGSNKGKILAVLVLILLVCSAGLYFLLADRQKPQINLLPRTEYVNEAVEVEIEARDRRAGLARLRVAVVQGDAEQTLFLSELKNSPGQWSKSIPVGEMKLKDGPFRLVVEAWDSSWARFFQGRKAVAEQAYILDTTAPRVKMKSFRHNVQRGGTGLVAFRVEEDPDRAGVAVGDTFFPAYRQESGVYLGLFSYPYHLRSGQERPMVLVRDPAGNVRKASIQCNIRNKRLPHSRIRITDRFLNQKMPAFQDTYPDIRDKLELFVAVNEKLRQENRSRIHNIGRDTASSPLWSGRFLRQRGAKQSSFAVHRDYYYQSGKISQSTHLGIDLASVARAKVPAANSGQVVYADWLGIYGQTVIIDHGLGLQSLYGHLSQIQVSEGQRMEKGEILGRTGATGLAGGDHLHFEMVVSGVPVTPVEWWDEHWIGDNILPKLRKAGEEKTD